MDKIDPKVIATAKDIFKKYPKINKLYVDTKSRLHFTAGEKRVMITRSEIYNFKSNKNNDKS